MDPKLARRYLEDGMATIPKPQLLLRLYERLQVDLERAVEAVDQADIEASHNALVHGQDIVYELNLALDVEQWEDGRRLRSIYQHVTELLIDANMTKSTAPIHEAARLIDPLCDAWREAIQQLAASPAAGSATAPAAAASSPSPTPAPASAAAAAAYGGGTAAAPKRTQVVG